jgi:hypothetical protein
MRQSRALVLVLPLAFAVGAGTSSTSTASSQAPTKTEASTSKAPRAEALQGFLVAQNATDHYAPEFVFRIPGWSSDWGWRKLVELVADGTEVKAGDVVARFEFGAEQALQNINERIQKSESDLAQATIAAGQNLDALEMTLRRKRMDQDTARLNLQRAPALSKNQADALAISVRLAEFDVAAAEQLLASARAAEDASVAHKRKARDAALELRARYDWYLARFTVRAAHDGIVRHAFNPRERRKLQKGDGVQAGMKVVSVAKDDTLAVRFFVPEAQASRLALGQRVRVLGPSGGEEIDGLIARVDFFPQELGFLLENDQLPNAREKAVEVRATLTGAPKNLAAGTEVRVRLIDAPAAPASNEPNAGGAP